MILQFRVLLFLALNTVAFAVSLHDRQFWQDIARQHYVVPDGSSASALAHELSGLLASPDPELRDDLAYSILTHWIRGGKLPDADLISLEEWRANLKNHVGESDNETVFLRSFSARCLSEMAAHDLKAPFLGVDRYHTLVSHALAYLNQEHDLRGYEVKLGWIHATAHTADLLEALAENSLFTTAEQNSILDAIAERLATARVIYTHGEQDRLALAVVAIIERKDFDLDAFERWMQRMQERDRAMWKLTLIPLEEMARYQNDSYLIEALAARLANASSAPSTTSKPRSANALKAYEVVLAAVGER